MVNVNPYQRRYAVHHLSAGRVDGVLKARKYRGPPKDEYTPGTLFPIDVLLGDDEFIFLHVEEELGAYEPGEGPDADYGSYTFDAEQLIKEGAYLRLGDIIKTQEWITFAHDFAHDYPMLPPLTYNGPGAPSKETLQRIILRSPSLTYLFNEVKKKRAAITLSGDDAIRALYDGRCALEKTKCELLVPKELSLAKRIVTGQWPRDTL